MLTVTPTGAVLGATIEGLDLSRSLTDREFAEVLAALGRYGVLRFPDQRLDSQALKAFSERFGDIQGSGLPDAGQDWHTDMSYRDVMGFVNVLYGVMIPRRGDAVLGGTEFANMHAGYTTRIDGLAPRESDDLLDFLFGHQLQDAYRYTHTWAERDVLVWDHFGTIHRAIADYRADELRLMKRCQVMATKIIDPAFVRAALGEHVPA